MATSVFVDYYALLEVDPRASSAQIKQAYRTCMLRDHADQNPGDALAHERMILLSRAKTVLLDERQRHAFDRDRARWLAAAQFGVAPPRWSGGRAPNERGHGYGAQRIEVDLSEVSLGRLIVGVGVAAAVAGFGFAARAVANRNNRRRRRRW